ncbi:hypothetical protein [Rothia sp. CCM 9416]|uniref:hypothetical protein n=1 Tax=Rothia sp. CCM 9416 TaxID=3402655 RepID=UPI003AE4562C
MTESSEAQQIPLAVRRLRKLYARNPLATPAELIQHLGSMFVRDFTLVGSAQAGAQELTPNLLGTVTRHQRVAGLTQAAAHLGALKEGTATYTRAASQGIRTTGQVGSSQAIKTYLHGVALIYGIPVANSDEAAQAVLGTDVKDLLTHIETGPEPTGSRPSQINVLGAVAAIGLRNPQTLLLVTAGEQLIKAGGAMLANQSTRKDFAQQLIAQVEQTLGQAPAQFSHETLELMGSQNPTAQPPQEIAPVEQVRPSTEQELAEASGVSARGARLAARAFVRARTGLRNK